MGISAAGDIWKHMLEAAADSRYVSRCSVNKQLEQHDADAVDVHRRGISTRSIQLLARNNTDKKHTVERKLGNKKQGATSYKQKNMLFPSQVNI